MPAQSDDDHGSDNYANNNYRETYIIEIMKKKDPTSHRIIEKRRRDRMNNCLADLSKLIPAHYMKKGRGRVEKTEIIEMAIKHLKDLIAMTSAKQMGPNDNNHLSIQQDKHQQQQVAAAAAAVSIKSDQEQQLQRPSHSNGSAIIRNNGPSWYKKAWLVRWLLALAAEVSDESRLSWR